MQEFDPRRPAFRLAPRLMMGLAGCCALALGWRLTGAVVTEPAAGRVADTIPQFGALVRIKAAASQYPHPVILVKRRAKKLGGGWTQDEF